MVLHKDGSEDSVEEGRKREFMALLRESGMIDHEHCNECGKPILGLASYTKNGRLLCFKCLLARGKPEGRYKVRLPDEAKAEIFFHEWMESVNHVWLNGSLEHNEINGIGEAMLQLFKQLGISLEFEKRGP